jgi:hypothetical protein
MVAQIHGGAVAAHADGDAAEHPDAHVLIVGRHRYPSALGSPAGSAAGQLEWSGRAGIRSW